MLISGELFCSMSHVTGGNDRLTRKGDFGPHPTHVSGCRYTFSCIIDMKQGTLCPHIRDFRVPNL